MFIVNYGDPAIWHHGRPVFHSSMAMATVFQAKSLWCNQGMTALGRCMLTLGRHMSAGTGGRPCIYIYICACAYICCISVSLSLSIYLSIYLLMVRWSYEYSNINQLNQYHLISRPISEMPRVPGWDEGSSNTGHAICLLQELHDGQRVLIIAFGFLIFLMLIPRISRIWQCPRCPVYVATGLSSNA